MPNSVQISFIEEAIDNLQELNEWENDFINSIAELPNDVQLTAKQNDKLNEIQRKLKSLGVT